MALDSLDPLGYDLPLPLEARYYPMGFPLIVQTNSPAVLAAIRKTCSCWRERDEPAAPITIRVAVSDVPATVQPVPAMPCGQGHLVTIIHGTENFAVCDAAASFGFARFTRDVVDDAAYVSYHFLEPMIWLLVDAAHLAAMHSSCVALHGRAVILCGDSGAGKTSLAYACARLGWTYLSDDATHVLRRRGQITVAGRPFQIRFRDSARELFPELSGFTPVKRPNGKRDLEIDTAELGLPVAVESAASHVVFLNRNADGERASIRPYPASLASARLKQLVCHGDTRVRTEQRLALDRLLTLPTLELRWHDLRSAESSLRSLVESSA